MAVEISQHQFSMCRKLMDNFVTFMHPFNHLPTPHLESQPYTPRMQLADVHFELGKLRTLVYPHK